MTVMDLSQQASRWRETLKQRQRTLREEFLLSGNTPKLLRQHAKLVDDVLIDIWQNSLAQLEVCLVAVGGYGRNELFPYSDVDLLILLPEQALADTNVAIENMVGIFWDIGLNVGHSVRTVAECVSESGKDVTVQTNLLEARYLKGQRKLFQQFEQAMHSNMQAPEFYRAKMHEQEKRHARFNDSAYNLEPNIKESPGGLRDLQNVLWIARSMGLGASWNALVEHELISRSEMQQIRRHERYLQMLRVRLHYLANRREDRLIFDFQNDLAKDLGLVSSGRKRASEQLMHNYYRTAKFVSLMNEILLQLLQEHLYPQGYQVNSINEHFESHNGLLYAKSATLLQRQPSSIFEIFLILEQHPELKGLSAKLLRTVHRVKKLVNREFRQDPHNKQLFLQILKQKQGVTDALRRMNRYGILGSYIPVFGSVTGQMQHDLFHVYTVDEHILNVLGNLHRFSQAEYAHEFPLCSKLFTQFDAPHLLYLGALFHDIAKGRGGDHSSLGTVDARRFCSQHGLNKADRNLVAWLVESHLIMSSTAQKSDLSDPQVIETFAKRMGNERNLTALYLLTVADIRGTSPKVWNAWKAKLLENLFLAALRILRGTGKIAEDEILVRKTQASKTLSHYGVPEKSYFRLWEKLGPQYFMRHNSQDIAWHSRLLITHINTQSPIVRTRLSPEGDGIQVMIYMLDHDDLFAQICSFFERIGYNILEARVHTSDHGYALDSFLVLDQNEKDIKYRDLLSYIEFELTKKLAANKAPEKPAQGRLSRQVKHMPIKTSIQIKPELGSNNHILEIITGDRPGLLSLLANTLLRLDIHLQTAKINTLGKRAEDTFLISARNNVALTEQQLQKLQEQLASSLP